MRLVGDGLAGGGQLPMSHGLAYWAYHVGRINFFLTQAAAGLLAAQITQGPGGVPASALPGGLGHALEAGALWPVVETIVTYYQVVPVQQKHGCSKN